MAALVELPAGDLIDYLEFARVLAEAASPVVEDGATGMACITGKSVRYALPPEAIVGWRQPDQLPAETSTIDKQAAFELQLPYKLTQDDVRHLGSLLPHLPDLCSPLSEATCTEFLEAYRRISETDWEPVLLTERDVEAQRQRQGQVCANFRQALKDEFSSGRLVACDVHRIPVHALGLGSFVPRQSALEYLKRYGLEYCETGAAATSHSSLPIDATNADFNLPAVRRTEPIATGQIPAATNARISPADYARRPEWTAQQYQELADYYAKRKAVGKRPRPLLDCAEKFGITERTVGKKLEKWAKHPSNPRNLTFILAGR